MFVNHDPVMTLTILRQGPVHLNEKFVKMSFEERKKLAGNGQMD